jgi:hypothetical protein
MSRWAAWPAQAPCHPLQQSYGVFCIFCSLALIQTRQATYHNVQCRHICTMPAHTYIYIPQHFLPTVSCFLHNVEPRCIRADAAKRIDLPGASPAWTQPMHRQRMPVLGWVADERLASFAASPAAVPERQVWPFVLCTKLDRMRFRVSDAWVDSFVLRTKLDRMRFRVSDAWVDLIVCCFC